jgi:hypothetical protein
MRRVLVMLIFCSMVAALSGPAAAAEPSFVSLLFGRTQWAHARNCVAVTNGVNLGSVAQELAARDLTATGNIVLNQVKPTGFWCEGGFALHPGWDRILPLRDAGWSFVSAGKYYRFMPNLTYAQQLDNSCGSLPVFQARGIDAGGLFAYPNDKYNTAVQTNPVSTCFDWGRTYGTGVTSRSTAGPPWFQSTHTVQGARCSKPNAGCPYAAQYKWQYTHPDWMVATIRSLQPGQWYTMQFYRFVTGTSQIPNDRFQWDCRAEDPAAHWATRPEVYCWTDFLRVLDALAQEVDAGRLVVTDPASVADAWGR